MFSGMGTTMNQIVTRTLTSDFSDASEVLVLSHPLLSVRNYQPYLQPVC